MTILTPSASRQSIPNYTLQPTPPPPPANHTNTTPTKTTKELTHQQQNARRSRVDQLIQHVVAQEKVAMTNKCKATCANKVGQGCRQCAFRLISLRGLSIVFKEGENKKVIKEVKSSSAWNG
jgi:hypothetical protein